jgi:hypothetical protein
LSRPLKTQNCSILIIVILVAVDGDTLCLKPKRALDDSLLARIREVKPAILEALRNGLSACGLKFG